MSYARSMAKKNYHHGDLRAALLTAAEIELEEFGLETFSLRRVAMRAGVSHAAPAHHFGDVQGLLTALSTIGYRRFVETQQLRQEKAKKDPRSHLIAAGLGYVDFAMQNTALFRLMFGSDRPNENDPDYQAATAAAFDHLAKDIHSIAGKSPYTDTETMFGLTSVWAIAHGLADLLSTDRLMFLKALEPEQRDGVLTNIIAATIDANVIKS